ESAYAEAAGQRDEARTAREVAEGQRDKARTARALADKHRAAAEASAREARAERDKARKQKVAADRSFRLAHAAGNDFILYFSQELQSVPALQPLRRKLLRIALTYYRDFLQERGSAPELREEMALAHVHVAKLTESIGSRAEAMASYRQAIALYRGLLREGS